MFQHSSLISVWNLGSTTWHAAVHGVAKSQTRPSDRTTLKKKTIKKKQKLSAYFFYLKSETSEAYYGVPKLKFQK